MERSRRTDASVRRDSVICRCDIWPFDTLYLFMLRVNLTIYRDTTQRK